MCFDSIGSKDNLSHQALLDRLFSSRVLGARAQKKHTLDQRANEKLNAPGHVAHAVQ